MGLRPYGHPRHGQSGSPWLLVGLRDATPAQIAHMRQHYYGNITTVDEMGN
ncbi:MAG TPA: hypothetical protein QF604_21870 [Candidatus Latescibacteria bacterium]|nr:hypothetical protein [Candidatus Latescibacterota bacterium]HJN30563.1 hypothetical protein [Candidatus Latescibacterota bacterium]